MRHLSVSAVVPTYDRASLLKLALRSADLPHCGPGDEIIVVDDGSADDAEAVVVPSARRSAIYARRRRRRPQDRRGRARKG